MHTIWDARRHLAMPALVLIAGMALFVLGLWSCHQDMLSWERYRDLADTNNGLPDTSSQDKYGEDQCGGQMSDSIPTDGNTDAIAWVRVYGTPIDLPVASGERGFTWYLHHDLWGNETELGCPFIDPRCPSEDASHVIVYGHHLSLTNLMFSSLHRCYLQNEFDKLGTCLWTTRKRQVSLTPLCSLSVDQDWEDIIRFTFSNEDDLHRWLLDILSHAPATAPKADLLATGSQQVVTLVTCSSEFSGRRLRTLVIFVA